MSKQTDTAFAIRMEGVRTSRRVGSVDVNLFAGAGGLAIGLEQGGFADIHMFELDAYACQTLQYNTISKHVTLHGVVHPGDVRRVDWRQFDWSVRLLAAGVPCQPFSVGGVGRGHADGRNLFPETLRAFRALEPSAALLENVSGLLFHNDTRKYFDYVLRQLRYPSIAPRSGEGWREHDRRLVRREKSRYGNPEYRVVWKLVNTADYGVPQVRYRVFIVATRRDLPEYAFPETTHSRNELLHSLMTGRYWRRHGLRRRNLNLDGHVWHRDGKAPWHTVRDALVGLPEMARTPAVDAMNHWRIPGAREYERHTGSRVDWPSKTLKAGVHGVPGGENSVILDNGRLRYFTFREAARLQTFPDEHIFLGSRNHVTSQIGNAVPCKLAKVLAQPLHSILSGGK